MAYMCADSGNLMAIAQQVIQQQQQQQQQHHHHLPPPPLPMQMPPRQAPAVPTLSHGQIPAASYGGGAWPHSEHFFADAFVGAPPAETVFSDLPGAVDFDSDGWMESLIADAPVFADSDLDRLIFTTPPPPVPVPVPPPAPATQPVEPPATHEPKAAAPASLPQVATTVPSACSSPSSLDASCAAPILQSLLGHGSANLAEYTAQVAVTSHPPSL